MGKIGMTELILILSIALVIFGPSKLPAIGKSMEKPSVSSNLMRIN